MLDNGDGTFTGGPLDLLCILGNSAQGTFHAAFFEEKPMPGPVPDVENTMLVRLKSKFSHTVGGNLEEARVHLADLAQRIKVPDLNVNSEDVFPWDGEIGIVWMVPNWTVLRRKLLPSDVPTYELTIQPSSL